MQVNGEMLTVDVDDGLLAVTLGVAAHKSIDEMRICELSSLLPAEVIKEVKGSRLRRRKLMVSRKRKKPSSM